MEQKPINISLDEIMGGFKENLREEIEYETIKAVLAQALGEKNNQVISKALDLFKERHVPSKDALYILKGLGDIGGTVK